MATLHPKKLPKPPPYDFMGERERIAAHERDYAVAKDMNGNQPTCPYCFESARITFFQGRQYLTCKCKAR